MHTVTVLAVLATLLRNIAAQEDVNQSLGVTTNFTSPEGPRVDLSEDVDIAWEMTSDRSADEYKWRHLRLMFCVRGEDVGGCWEFAKVDHHTTNNYAWEGAAAWFNETFSIQSWNLTGGEDFYLRGRLRDDNTTSSMGVFDSTYFRVDGVEGFENESGATKSVVSTGVVLMIGILLGGAWML